MTKTLRFMLLTLLTLVCGNAFAQNEATWQASSKDALSTVLVGNDIKLIWEEGGGDMAPKYSGDYVYFYNGNRVTVAGASDEVKISKVVFKFKTDTKTGIATCDASGKNVSTTGITNDNEALTSTWEGTAVNSIIFRAAQTTGVRYIESITVTYEGSAPVVEKTPVLAITQDGIADTYDMDANGVFVVYYENQGTLAAENAKLTLYVDGNENASKTIGTLNIGTSSQNFWNAKYNLEGLEAGEHQVYLSFTADNAETVNTTAKTVTFTKAAPVPAFTITAQAVTVAYDAESYDVVATLTETNNVAATGVKVELRKGISEVLATQTVDVAAGGEQQVTLTVAKELFETGEKTYNLYVNDKFLSSVAVTFEEAPVVETKDLAITEVLGTIKLAEETNQVRVTVQNNGNVDITDAAVVLKAGETTLGEGTVSATAGNSNYTMINVIKEGLEAGSLEVTATVTVEGDATPEDNVKTATLTVEAAPVPEATYSVAAENVTVAYGAESFEIKATVKNTSEVDATDVAVKLLKGITEVETKTIALTAGAEETVTFTVNEIGEAGKTVNYFVQVANKAQAEVEVTFEEAPVEQVVAVALTQISLSGGQIDLAQTANVATVSVENTGNVDAEATINMTLNGTALEAQTVTVKAGNNGMASFTLPTEGLVAGEKATIVATVTVADNTAETTTITKEYDIVDSSIVEPAPVIALNPVSSWEVEEAGEQTINVSVGVFNNGNADAEEVTVKVYQTLGTDLDSKTVAIAQGESALVSLSFTYDIQQATTFHVIAYIGTTPVTEAQDFTISVKQQVADVAVAKIADIEATTEDEVVIAATLKNNSAITAENVLVALYQGTEQVGTTKNVNEIEANGEAQVEFNLGKLAAGNYSYNVMITSTDGNMDNNVQSVSVKVTEYVAPVVNVALTAIQGISNIDLAEGANNTISVWVQNEGNVDAEATIAVTLNGTAVGEAQTITLKAEKSGNVSFTLPTEGLVAGETATVVATVTVADNTAETVTLTKEYNIVNSSVATEPTFEVAAENVTVPFDATSFDIVATVKNTSTVDAENVEVKLTKGIEQIGEAQTIATLAGGAEATLTFTVNEVAAGTYYVNVANNKAIAEVTVTVEAEPVTPVVAVALTHISLAGGQIDLAQDANIATVSVENTGNVDAEATIGLKLNDTELEAQTVTVKAEGNAIASFTLPTEGLEAGQKATIVATVAVADNTAEKVTETKEYDVVNSAVVTEPDFSVTAENVTVEYGAEYFEIQAVVKNTTEINATNVEVKLLKGITEVATTTISELAAGAEQPVVFQVEPTEENPFVAGTTATYYVQAAGKAQAEVTVTFAEEPVAEVVDLAVTSISGTLSMDVENNYITVFVENKGNVDVTDATVTLKAGDVELGTANVTVKAGATGFCSIAVPATALTAGEFTVVATVTAEGEAEVTLEDNTLEKTYTIAAPTPELSFTVVAETEVNAETLPVKVTVKNSEKAAAENIVVTVYDASSNKLGETTIAALAVGAEETVTIEVEKTYTEAGTQKSQLQVTVSGVEGVKWVDVTVTDTTTAIEAIKAQYGENVQIYTLNGRRVNNVQKGQLYIINGKKMMVK